MTFEEASTAERRAGRLLIIDGRNRILLFSCFDPSRPGAPSWWFTPGGGTEGNESVEEAARREGFEETGLVVDELGPAVHRRRASFDFEDLHYEQEDVFFLVRVERHRVDESAWTDDERRVITGHRWWSAEELAATTEHLYPSSLVELLSEIGAFTDGEKTS